MQAVGFFTRALSSVDEWAALRAGRHGRPGVFFHEFVCFGLKQASACLFGGIMVALLLLTFAFYPADAWLARYDFLVLAGLGIQLALLALGLETREEARVILLFHLVGTAMEVFKTAMGSWAYPEASVLRIGGVPLFTGFMYASVGSYIARAWRVFDFRFTGHPTLPACILLSMAIYANFFAHHYLPDARPVLFLAIVLLFGPASVHYRIRHVHRRMSLLLGLVLVALFIWFAENIGTYSRAWIYPSQHAVWTPVPFGKLGAWLLLLVISYVMVWAVHARSTVIGMKP